ncbi:MAG: hypothetical protein ACE5EA_06355 [Nitrospirota bacterium]
MILKVLGQLRGYVRHRDRKIVVITAISIIICCVLVGCPEREPRPSPEEIVRCCVGNINTSPELKREIRIYLDGSLSMRGYVNYQGNTNTVFGRVIQGLRSLHLPKYETLFYKLGRGEPAGLEPNQFWLMSKRDGISLYDQGETHLDLTIAGFLAQDKPAGAYLVITDGVQASKSGSNYPAFVDPIIEWLERGDHILHIYAFRGEFNGTVYGPETGNRFKYSSTPDDTSTYRPFYIYAFIMDKDIEDRISQNIQGIGGEYHLLDLSEDIVRGIKRLAFKTGDKSCLKRLKTEKRMGYVIQYLRGRCKDRDSGREPRLRIEAEIAPTPFGGEFLKKMKNNKDMVMVGGEIREWKRREGVR